MHWSRVCRLKRRSNRRPRSYRNPLITRTLTFKDVQVDLRALCRLRNLCDAQRINPTLPFLPIDGGEWLLIKPGAYYFDYAPFKEAFKQQRVMEMLASPPPQVKEAMKHMRIITRFTEDTLPSRRYYATINGRKGQRRIDAWGIAQIPEPPKGAQVNLHVLKS